MSLLIVRGLQSLVERRIRQKIHGIHTDNKFFILHDPRSAWANAHYLLVAQLMGTSASFVKRLFGYGGNRPPQSISQKSKEKVRHFLEIDSLEGLDRAIYQEAIRMVD